MIKRTCHLECLNKQWELQEDKGFGFIRIPHVKIFDCLAEARKAHIYYMKNLDFQNIRFRLRLKEDAKE